MRSIQKCIKTINIQLVGPLDFFQKCSGNLSGFFYLLRQAPSTLSSSILLLVSFVTENKITQNSVNFTGLFGAAGRTQDALQRYITLPTVHTIRSGGKAQKAALL
jgi:hypothetical protein